MAKYFLISAEILLTCLLNIIASIRSSKDGDQTQICVKKIQKNDGSIPETSHMSFQQFIAQSDILIDKSLLIAELMSHLEKHSTLVIAAPGKWGKSLNLKMVKFFLDIELNKNFERMPTTQTKAHDFFVNGEITEEDGSKNNFNNVPLISKKTDFIRKHLNRYVAVYIDFSVFTGTIPDYFFEYKKMIALLFKEYYSVVHKLCVNRMNSYNRNVNGSVCVKTELNDFQNIHNKLEKEEEKWMNALKLLSRLLKQYYEADVVFLLDEYDSLVNKMYFINYKVATSKKTVAIDFTENIFQKSLRENHNVKFAIITGTLPLVFHNKLPTLNNDTLYLKHLSRPLFPYYGFRKQETEQLFAIKNISLDLMTTAIEYYNNYHVENEDHETTVFRPSSIIKFLNTEIFQNYWSNLGDEVLTAKFISNIRVQVILVNLLRGKCEFGGLLEDLISMEEFAELIRIISSKYQDNYDEVENDFLLWYLYIEGLITKVQDNDGKLYMEIPNNENTAEITRIFFNREITHGGEEPAAHAFIKAIENSSYSTVDAFAEEAEKLLVDKTRKKSLYTNDLYYDLKLFYVMKTAIKLYNSYVDATEPVEVLSNLNKTYFEVSFPDISIHDYRRCGIIDVVCNITKDDLALLEGKYGFRPFTYGNHMLSKHHLIKRVRVIRVHVLPDETIDVNSFYRFIMYNGTTSTMDYFTPHYTMTRPR